MKTDQAKRSLNQRMLACLDFTLVADQDQNFRRQLKEYLALSNEFLEQGFHNGTNIRKLVQTRSRHIDQLLLALAKHLAISDQVALIAVGGYGRGELHPQSDIDLLLLTEQTLAQAEAEKLEQLIAFLWDSDLKVGQSVRTLDECVQLAREEVTVTTNLMESRLLAGPKTLFQQVKAATSPDKMWSPQAFFDAKTTEQRTRYKKFDGSSFDLEPNIKSSPGGLRDIQLIDWVARRTFYPKTLDELLQLNVVTKKEYYTLVKCQLHIWRVRFALHLVSGKPEDRLLFDHQKTTAKMMGYQDTQNSLAVEKMMKRYYRSALIIRNISDILLQMIEEHLKAKLETPKVQAIDEQYQVVNERIDAIDAQLFVKDPSQLLKVFQYVARDVSLKGITARSLRAIRAARYKITPSFRHKKANKAAFVDFWHIMHRSSRAMFLMKRSGVLADYLTPFAQITGQMQYDMFHNYTVDEHTLFLLKNLTEFAAPEHDQAFPICSQIMQRQTHPEIIFLAGLFHDIGKGRGGDHSELGALEAREFCRQHQLDESHAQLVEWLVANHLIMSLTAQKRDISDPKVIENFAKLVGDQQHLELLYILTVADIRATSHSLWNSWKDSLLKNLYQQTSAWLKQSAGDIVEDIESHRSQAKTILLGKGHDAESIENLWQSIDEHYFEKRPVETIVWQTNKVLADSGCSPVLVGIRSLPQSGGTQVFVYAADKQNLFAALTATLSQLNLSIQAASIYTDRKGYCYDSFVVLEADGQPVSSVAMKTEIKTEIVNNISDSNEMTLTVQRRVPRQFKYFSIPTQVEFFEDEYTGFTRMELIARDEPGLLASVGKAFVNTNIRLHDARIATLGEKVEDIFIISQRDNSPISQAEDREAIRQEILRQLDN